MASKEFNDAVLVASEYLKKPIELEVVVFHMNQSEAYAVVEAYQPGSDYNNMLWSLIIYDLDHVYRKFTVWSIPPRLPREALDHRKKDRCQPGDLHQLVVDRLRALITMSGGWVDPEASQRRCHHAGSF